VLLNLVQNAQEAMPGQGEIEIKVLAEDRNAIIEVTDTGAGISADALPHVFDPFFTTKADVRGVGLGLFTAAGLARRHGGRIAASGRTDGRGARLTIEIPLVEPAMTEIAAEVGA
jgi:signal transduction histidine kinase